MQTKSDWLNLLEMEIIYQEEGAEVNLINGVVSWRGLFTSPKSIKLNL